jgi:hypothetical protein
MNIPRSITRMTAAEFLGIMHPSQCDDNPSLPKVQSAQPQQIQAKPLVRRIESEAGSLQRVIVRIVGYRVQLLDPDNFAGGCKDLLDGIRHAGIISGDSTKEIDFKTDQIRVRHRYEERTEVEITIGEIQ